jgi:hypothetical protein
VESEACRRLVNALTDMGYHVTPVSEDRFEFRFSGNRRAQVVVKESSPLKGKALPYPWKEDELWQNEGGSERI